MDHRLLREFCAENHTFVPAAIEAGAGRIELCDNLAVGGTTPSAGVIEATVAYAHGHGARVMTMIRPRGGDFVYSEAELEIMERDIDIACRLGTDGVVLGCLREGAGGFELDLAATRRLLARVRDRARERARAVDVTFHMAFDALSPEAQLEAVDELARAGVARILTHGGPAGTSIEDNIPSLRALVARAADGVAIVPGAGITYANAERIARAAGVSEVHGTRIVAL